MSEPAASSRAARFAALTSLLLLAHCAWQRPGVLGEIALVSDDPDGPRVALDAAGRAFVLEEVRLDVQAIALVPCPGTRSVAALTPLPIARAHGEDVVVGPVTLDLTDAEPLPAQRIGMLPGAYCDVRLGISGIAIRTDDGTVLEAGVAREALVRMPRQELSRGGDLATVTLHTATSELLARIDVRATEPDLAALRALGALLDGLAATLSE